MLNIYRMSLLALKLIQMVNSIILWFPPPENKIPPSKFSHPHPWMLFGKPWFVDIKNLLDRVTLFKNNWLVTVTYLLIRFNKIWFFPEAQRILIVYKQDTNHTLTLRLEKISMKKCYSLWLKVMAWSITFFCHGLSPAQVSSSNHIWKLRFQGGVHTAPSWKMYVKRAHLKRVDKHKTDSYFY